MDYSQGYLSKQEQLRKRKRILRLSILVCVFFLLGFLIFNLRRTVDSTSTHLDAEVITPTSILLPTPTSPPNSSSLETTVQNTLQGTHGTYGIVVQNLKTGEYYGLNEHQIFKSGSLYKLWVMAVVYQQIQQGKLHLTDSLSKDLGDLAKEFNVSIDPTEPQTSGVLTMTVSDALYQMVTISDNNAALLLTDKVKIPSLVSFLKTNGLYDSRVGVKGEDPITTPADIALFFNKLYNGQLANQEQTTNMLNLLKQQRLNSKIPQNLPDSITIAHKTGEIDDYSHDAGIVYGSGGDYILVVLTKSDDTDAAIGRIANVSEAVYNYFDGSSVQ